MAPRVSFQGERRRFAGGTSRERRARARHQHLYQIVARQDYATGAALSVAGRNGRGGLSLRARLVFRVRRSPTIAARIGYMHTVPECVSCFRVSRELLEWNTKAQANQ